MEQKNMVTPEKWVKTNIASSWSKMSRVSKKIGLLPSNIMLERILYYLVSFVMAHISLN